MHTQPETTNASSYLTKSDTGYHFFAICWRSNHATLLKLLDNHLAA